MKSKKKTYSFPLAIFQDFIFLIFIETEKDEHSARLFIFIPKVRNSFQLVRKIWIKQFLFQKNCLLGT